MSYLCCRSISILKENNLSYSQGTFFLRYSLFSWTFLKIYLYIYLLAAHLGGVPVLQSDKYAVMADLKTWVCSVIFPKMVQSPVSCFNLSDNRVQCLSACSRTVRDEKVSIALLTKRLSRPYCLCMTHPIKDLIVQHVLSTRTDHSCILCTVV